jgi:hypothetical protein
MLFYLETNPQCKQKLWRTNFKRSAIEPEPYILRAAKSLPIKETSAVYQNYVLDYKMLK